MPLPPLVRKLAETKLIAFCERRVPTHIRDKIRLEIGFRDMSATLYELRPPWAPSVMGPEWTKAPVAQFRYDPDSRMWTLYCCDRHSRWHEYYEIGPSLNLNDLIGEVDEDGTGVRPA